MKVVLRGHLNSTCATQYTPSKNWVDGLATKRSKESESVVNSADEGLLQRRTALAGLCGCSEKE